MRCLLKYQLNRYCYYSFFTSDSLLLDTRGIVADLQVATRHLCHEGCPVLLPARHGRHQILWQRNKGYRVIPQFSHIGQATKP